MDDSEVILGILSCVVSVSGSWLMKARFQESRNQVGNMNTDPISDMLTRIRNAAAVKKSEVVLPYSKVKFSIAKILEKEGYVGKVAKLENEKFAQLKVGLKYKDKSPVISKICRISKPGRRVYSKHDELPVVLSDMGIAIVSTPNGLMTNKDARKRHLGGEVICEVY